MPRIDEILDAREAIRRCLPLLAKNGLALRFYGTGVENFSADENMRMNKGITAAQVTRRRPSSRKPPRAGPATSASRSAAWG